MLGRHINTSRHGYLSIYVTVEANCDYHVMSRCKEIYVGVGF